MNRNDFESQAEKYKQEMMKLYGRSTVSPEERAQEEKVPEAEELPNVEDNAAQPEEIEEKSPDDTAFAPHIDDEELGEEDYNSRYPEPDLSVLGIESGADENIDSQPPEYASEESLGDSKGFILVNVRTGDESAAIEGATVMVTAVIDGKRMILASGVTNENGTAPKFELPVPAYDLSQSPSSGKRPYNLFDVSVTAEGFFNARSVDVPVFSGITSVQNFNMIPVPMMMNPTDETVTIYNKEPELPMTGQNGG